MRKSIIGFCLHEQALRVGNLHKRCETCLVTRAHLRFSGPRGVQFHGSILGDLTSPFERSLRLAELPRQVLQVLIVASLFGAFSGRFSRLSRADREDVEQRESYRQADRPVRTIRPLGLPCLPRNCPQGPIRCRARTPKTENRISDSRNGPKCEPVPALLPPVRAVPPQSDGRRPELFGESYREVHQRVSCLSLLLRYPAIRECRLMLPR